ncbi:TRAP transporter small permease [Guggenheimella bovis]
MKKKVLSVLDRIEEFFLVSMFIAMVLIIFFQVIMRFSKNSLSWSEELGKFIFVWISWIGISIGQRKNEHIRITMLTDRLPYGLKKVVEIISELIVIGICVITAYYSYSLVLSQASTPYAGIKISMSYGYLSVLVGTILMIIRCLVTISDHIRALGQGEPIEGEEVK